MKTTTKLRKENNSLKEENRKLIEQNESFEVNQDIMKNVIDDKSKQIEELEKDKEECNKLKTKIISEYFLNTELERKKKTNETGLLSVGIQIIPDLIKMFVPQTKLTASAPVAKRFCDTKNT